MVTVRSAHALESTGAVSIADWVAGISARLHLDNKAAALLTAACELARDAEVRASDAPSAWSSRSSSFLTGLDMADILADMQIDVPSLLAAVLYRAVREGKLALAAVHETFGHEVAGLIDSVQRMAVIGSQRNVNEQSVLGQANAEQVENLRKMLVAIINDVRVALIKIAERTCAIRAVKTASDEKKRKVAKEVFDIYAPLAHRLGIGQLKWELEDISFRYLEPDIYKQLAELLHEKRLDREKFIVTAIDQLKTELTAVGIEAQIKGRPKHIYSIWRKMRQKGIGFSQVYDIRAVRVLVPTVEDCYRVLGIVHRMWRNIPNEFDDYIASPKENGYRSLHTAVVGPQGKVLEVQIRTHDMHKEAEFGVCAHWQYKDDEHKQASEVYEAKIEWLRQVLDWHEETGGDRSLVDEFRRQIANDKVYVFTRDGHVIEMQQGSTPVDFAYHIHTQIGHRCRGVKVNGRVVPLNQVLKTSDQIEILTGKREMPSRDWLSPDLGYTCTSRARSKIQQWFREQARDQNIAEGQVLLDREFKRLALMDLDFDALVVRLGLSSLDALYQAVGASDISVNDVLNAAQALGGGLSGEQQLSFPVLEEGQTTAPVFEGYFIEGVGSMPVHTAPCCQPNPADQLIGYITAGQEVEIHRQDCERMLQLKADEPQSVIRIRVGTVPLATYPVELVIHGWDRPGLLRDMTVLFDNERLNIITLNCLTDKASHTVDVSVILEVPGLNVLSRILKRISQLPNIISAVRQQ